MTTEENAVPSGGPRPVRRSKDKSRPAKQLPEQPAFAQAIEPDQFKDFLDHLPIAILIGSIAGKDERIIYANHEFSRLTGKVAAEAISHPWSVLDDIHNDSGAELGAAVQGADTMVGTFSIGSVAGRDRRICAYTSLIHDEGGPPRFRLAALVDITGQAPSERLELERRIQQRDTLLRELQHRVRNNLALITALIRLEARQMQDIAATEQFDRLAGRIESLSLLYQQLSAAEGTEEIDLGAYISQVSAAVTRSHAPERVRLNVQVDYCPVSVNVAMPIGLIVNEVLTNALKHAFTDRPSGTISVTCIAVVGGCEVSVSDDGIGMPAGTEWPRQGKLGALIVQSLQENAKANLVVESSPGAGTRVILRIVSSPASREESVSA